MLAMGVSVGIASGSLLNTSTQHIASVSTTVASVAAAYRIVDVATIGTLSCAASAEVHFGQSVFNASYNAAPGCATKVRTSTHVYRVTVCGLV